MPKWAEKKLASNVHPFQRSHEAQEQKSYESHNIGPAKGT